MVTPQQLVNLNKTKMKEYKVTYQDGTTAVLETPESAERLMQHAHIDKAVAVKAKKVKKAVKEEK